MYCQLSGSAGEAPEEIDESFFEDEDLIESDEEDETESSADLLIKFLQSMFKKASKHAKKASRSVLPAAISPQLVCLLFFTALAFFKKNFLLTPRISWKRTHYSVFFFIFLEKSIFLYLFEDAFDCWTHINTVHLVFHST